MRPHIARIDGILKLGWEVLEYRPYSPVLSPYDHHHMFDILTTLAMSVLRPLSKERSLKGECSPSVSSSISIDRAQRYLYKIPQRRGFIFYGWMYR